MMEAASARSSKSSAIDTHDDSSIKGTRDNKVRKYGLNCVSAAEQQLIILNFGFCNVVNKMLCFTEIMTLKSLIENF